MEEKFRVNLPKEEETVMTCNKCSKEVVVHGPPMGSKDYTCGTCALKGKFGTGQEDKE
jgi:hypothetical protein